MKRIILLVLIMSLSVFTFAESDEASETEDGKVNDFSFIILPSDIWEGESQLEFTTNSIIEDFNTVFKAEAYGGLVGKSYAENNDSYLVPTLSSEEIERKNYQNGYVKWVLGVEQGLIRDDETMKNLLSLDLEYIGRWELNSDYEDAVSTAYIFDNGLADGAGIFQNAIRVGLLYEGSKTINHSQKTGVSGNSYVEWGPSLFNEFSDYYMACFEVSGFLPIFDIAPERDLNLFNIYAAGRFKTTWLDGDFLPVNVRRDVATKVRGIDYQRYSTRFGASLNTELRMVLPAIIISQIQPIILLHADAGYYWEDESYSGFLATIGGTVALNIFDFVQVGGRLDYDLLQTKLDGEVLTPFSLVIQYHF